MTLDPKALDAARETKAVKPTLDQNALLAADDVWRMVTVGPMTTNILARCITAYLDHALPDIEAAAYRRGAEEMREQIACSLDEVMPRVAAAIRNITTEPTP